MSDLLKEAIADAKAVRETALQNAKIALEEAFTPQLKSMLSAKLKEDEFDDEEDVVAEPEEEIPGEEEEIPAEEGYYEDEEFGDEEEVPVAEPEAEPEAEFGDEEEVEEEGYGLDLEAIIKELEAEINEEDDAYDEKAAPEKDGLAEEDDAYPEKASTADKNDGKSSSTLAEDEEIEIDESSLTEQDDEDEDDDEDDETVEEQSSSSNIGNGDNSVKTASASDEEDPGKGKVHEIAAELKEYKEAVQFLKDKLHEVNILNAKLLFTNKLFKEYSLNNNQKLKVVETFDRAQTTREIKLVYSTLAEQFGDNSTINKKSINESASSKSGSTKPSKESRKVISEETNVANRFKKLAGLIK